MFALEDIIGDYNTVIKSLPICLVVMEALLYRNEIVHMQSCGSLPKIPLFGVYNAIFQSIFFLDMFILFLILLFGHVHSFLNSSCCCSIAYKGSKRAILDLQLTHHHTHENPKTHMIKCLIIDLCSMMNVFYTLMTPSFL